MTSLSYYKRPMFYQTQMSLLPASLVVAVGDFWRLASTLQVVTHAFACKGDKIRKFHLFNTHL